MQLTEGMTVIDVRVSLPSRIIGFGMFGNAMKLRLPRSTAAWTVARRSRLRDFMDAKHIAVTPCPCT
jgi:hypothetical protein